MLGDLIGYKMIRLAKIIRRIRCFQLNYLIMIDRTIDVAIKYTFTNAVGRDRLGYFLHFIMNSIVRRFKPLPKTNKQLGKSKLQTQIFKNEKVNQWLLLKSF